MGDQNKCECRPGSGGVCESKNPNVDWRQQCDTLNKPVWLGTVMSCSFFVLTFLASE